MGRKPKLDAQEVSALLSADATPKELASMFGISIASVYRYLRSGNHFKDEQAPPDPKNDTVTFYA